MVEKDQQHQRHQGQEGEHKNKNDQFPAAPDEFRMVVEIKKASKTNAGKHQVKNHVLGKGQGDGHGIGNFMML